MTKPARGFTLIELLVVIVIIGILATLATITLSSARSKARDARRVSDIKQIQTALELYYNDASSYPAATAVVSGSALVFNSVTYMAKIPADPLLTAAGATDGGCTGSATLSESYGYGKTGTSTYSIKYCLTGSTGSISAGTHWATPAGLQDP